MAETATEIDLDSVIDRLLEGEPATLLFLFSPKSFGHIALLAATAKSYWAPCDSTATLRAHSLHLIGGFLFRTRLLSCAWFRSSLLTYLSSFPPHGHPPDSTLPVLPLTLFNCVPVVVVNPPLHMSSHTCRPVYLATALIQLGSLSTNLIVVAVAAAVAAPPIAARVRIHR